MERTQEHVCKTQKVIDLLKELPSEQYNQSLWGLEQACGTVACICGWAHFLFYEDEPGPLNIHPELSHQIQRIAREVFGFDPNTEKMQLFSGRSVSKARAVRVLEHFNRTGVVNWELP